MSEVALFDGSEMRLVPSINSWIIVQYKMPFGWNSVSFNRSWVDYRDGFGDPAIPTNFWVGNEIIYSLTSGGQYQLSVEVRKHV